MDDIFKLNIVTPLILSRVQNLYKIKKDIDDEIANSRFNINWYIFFDYKEELPALDLNYDYTTLVVSKFKGSFKGNLQRNIALDIIKDGYICFMDDDNKFLPTYFDTIYTYIKFYNPNYDIYIGNQGREDGSIYDTETFINVCDENMKVGKVDGHQITFKREILGDLRWNNSPAADGEFIEKLHSLYKDRFKYIKEPISYHNYLAIKEDKPKYLVYRFKVFLKKIIWKFRNFLNNLISK